MSELPQGPFIDLSWGKGAGYSDYRANAINNAGGGVGESWVANKAKCDGFIWSTSDPMLKRFRFDKDRNALITSIVGPWNEKDLETESSVRPRDINNDNLILGEVFFKPMRDSYKSGTLFVHRIEIL